VGEVSAYVFLHDEPWLHFTVKPQLSKHDRMYVYEVIPVGPVFYGLEWDEYCTPAPVRVKNLVRAIRAKRKRRALLMKYKKEVHFCQACGGAGMGCPDCEHGIIEETVSSRGRKKGEDTND